MRRFAAGLILLASACGDPYAGYADSVHHDVDAAMADGYRMTARLQLTVVHNTIPFDSMGVVAAVTSRTARELLDRARHFARVSPPDGLGLAHAQLSGELTRIARALDTVSMVFHRCATAHAAGDATGAACKADLATLPPDYAYIGADLMVARNSVQRGLLGHGVVLGPVRMQ